ncbi:ATP-binding protein [Kitasatospora sp. HPMI-4]|uniref:ATP-binding protein n=1 Tax=Kitasatospora sp. HPMI-4 TaxID=3448443 RepID=UPI003F1CA5FC
MRLASLPPSIALARRITVSVLTAWGVPPKSSAHDTALLTITELVTNTVRHAAPCSPFFELLLAATDDHLEVAVRDSHPEPTKLPSPEEKGGLAVVAELAHDFGGTLTIEPDPDGGKTIRLLLPLTPPAATQE